MTFPFSLASRLPAEWALPDPGCDLVQLVRAIRGHFGPMPGDPNDLLTPGVRDRVSLRHRHVVLVLVDGLGDAYLQAHGGGGFLAKHRQAALSSVFPSTTASAITSLMTGLAPIQHGLLGWFVRDRRFGGILAPLMMRLRGGPEVRGPLRLQRLFPYRTLFQRMPCPSTVVSPLDILNSPFNRRHSRGASRLGYERLEGLVAAVCQAVRSQSAGGYVYAYYPRFDSLAHAFGIGSARVADEFGRIDGAVAALANGLQGLGVALLVTADHGFIDVPAAQTWEMEAWPAIQSLLEEPLWGERRAAWCAVRSGAESDFQEALGERLGPTGVVLSTTGLASSGLLGGGRPSPRLRERMGSHLILMAPGWALRDRVPGEMDHPMIGLHGGLSSNEMAVPLVHVDCG